MSQFFWDYDFKALVCVLIWEYFAIDFFTKNTDFANDFCQCLHAIGYQHHSSQLIYLGLMLVHYRDTNIGRNYINRKATANRLQLLFILNVIE